ncbi:hypothetical protein THRCLA_20043 [Thraustotheca clavata]|uniref:Uncharacterized protein n=1 Tax=Thraustotheca clavata TaxID=74557 RepID=A0A1W0ACB8_9STRA|nr:hypothetical protein THRCLA_20043 [Thraustotheca clavata]
MLATTTIPASSQLQTSSSGGYFASALSPVSAIQHKKQTSSLSYAMNPTPYNGRCKYKSGRCMNERTLKENGEPHTLCEEHRLLHNKNQRKSDTKRRRLRRALRNTNNNENTKQEDEEWSLQVTPLTLEESQLTAWTEEELHILAVLLEMPIVLI